MLEFVRIQVGEGIPSGCARCSTPTQGSYFASDEVVDAARLSSENVGVVLTGPEPFSHPELPAIVSGCVEAGIARIAIETDGGALSAGGNAAGVLHAGVRHLWVRVLAGDDALADELTGRSGLASAARAGVAAFQEAAGSAGVSVALTAVVPVCSHNLRDLPATMADLAARGYHAARLVPTSGRLPQEAAAVLAAACDTGMVNRLWVEADPGLDLPDTHRLHSVQRVVPDA